MSDRVPETFEQWAANDELERGRATIELNCGGHINIYFACSKDDGPSASEVMQIA